MMPLYNAHATKQTRGVLRLSIVPTKRSSVHWETNDESCHDHSTLESLPEEVVLVMIRHLDYAALCRLGKPDYKHLLPIIA